MIDAKDTVEILLNLKDVSSENMKLRNDVKETKNDCNEEAHGMMDEVDDLKDTIANLKTRGNKSETCDNIVCVYLLAPFLGLEVQRL